MICEPEDSENEEGVRRPPYFSNLRWEIIGVAKRRVGLCKSGGLSAKGWAKFSRLWLLVITCLLPLHNFDSLSSFSISQSYCPPNPEPCQDSWTDTEELSLVRCPRVLCQDQLSCPSARGVPYEKSVELYYRLVSSSMSSSRPGPTEPWQSPVGRLSISAAASSHNTTDTSGYHYITS